MDATKRRLIVSLGIRLYSAIVQINRAALRNDQYDYDCATAKMNQIQDISVEFNINAEVHAYFESLPILATEEAPK